MGKAFSFAFRYFILILMLLSFALVLDGVQKIRNGGTPVIFYYSDRPLSTTDVKNIRSEDEDSQIHIPFTACGNVKAQSFTNPDLGKNTVCEVIYISGDSSILIESFGGQIFEDDKFACILSKKTAWALFGESYVTSGTVEYGEKLYDVRGTCDYDESIIILPVAALEKKSSGDPGDKEDDDESSDGEGAIDDISFNKLIIKPEEGAKREELIQIFENRNDSSKDKTDCIIYHRLAQVLSSLPPLIILAAIMIRAISFCIRNRNKPFYLIGGIVAAAVLWKVFFMASGLSFSIPPDMIPSRWSDFNFWGTKISQLKSSIAHILFISKSDIELAFFEPLVSIAGMSIVCIALLFFCFFLFRSRAAEGSEKNGVYKTGIEIVAALVAELIAVMVVNTMSIQPGNLARIILIWPLFILSGYIFKKKLTRQEDL